MENSNGYIDTGYFDREGREILDGDVLINPFGQDLWVVNKVGNDWKVWLIPNSGMFVHNDNKYPQHTEYLDAISEEFAVVNNIRHCPEILDGCE